jgi:phage gpG-like protein
MRQIGQYGVESTRRRFFTETAPDGTHWAPLNPAYAELKGGGYNILYSSGALMNSLNARPGLNEVSWGSPMIYAAIHQFGGKIVPKTRPALSFLLGNVGSAGLVPVFLVRVKSVTMPARAYLGINLEDREEIVAISEDYVRALL